jgi:hypothetical protein
MFGKRGFFSKRSMASGSAFQSHALPQPPPIHAGEDAVLPGTNSRKERYLPSYYETIPSKPLLPVSCGQYKSKDLEPLIWLAAYLDNHLKFATVLESNENTKKQREYVEKALAEVRPLRAKESGGQLEYSELISVFRKLLISAMKLLLDDHLGTKAEKILLLSELFAIGKDALLESDYARYLKYFYGKWCPSFSATDHDVAEITAWPQKIYDLERSRRARVASAPSSAPTPASASSSRDFMAAPVDDESDFSQSEEEGVSEETSLDVMPASAIRPRKNS